MYKYRITKYNPLFRDDNGRYLIEDWTAISDIGKRYNGNILTASHYMKVEDKYINAVRLIMDFFNIASLEVKNINRSYSSPTNFSESIKRYGSLYSEDMVKLFERINDNDILEGEHINLLLRLMLREDIGADISLSRKLKIFVGYDFLMSVHTFKSIESILTDINEFGLFVEVLE